MSARRVASKLAARHVTPEELAQSTEFAHRRNHPRVEVKYVYGGPNLQDVVLHHFEFGDIGTLTNIYRRGKLAQVHYFLPKLPEGWEHMDFPPEGWRI